MDVESYGMLWRGGTRFRGVEYVGGPGGGAGGRMEVWAVETLSPQATGKVNTVYVSHRTRGR